MTNLHPSSFETEKVTFSGGKTSARTQRNAGKMSVRTVRGLKVDRRRR